MALTEEDLISKTPTIKKPKTLNPLGAVIFGLLLGIGHTLIYSSLLRIRYYWYFSIFGFLLIALSVLVIIVVISLTSKSILFTLKIEKVKTPPALSVLQILLFYLGFVPIYGFSIMYLEQTIEFWEIMVTTAIVVVLFALALLLNIFLIKKEKASLGHLKKFFYQPKKLLLIGIGIMISSIVTAIIFLF
ncbi:MAG: hypothetical protein GOP50_00130 [Candidatus Heimdallarchaeota archaeon]|nr:hypothetical protein [Candidatus Heimdallarchaeota archaeon]